MKRFCDLLVSTVLLLVLSPVILMVYIMVRWKLGTPAIFKQQRPGLNGQPFYILKFRSMTDQRDQDSNLLPDEVRLTPFGKMLRKFSLDELPQLLNVVRGDISLVGPRPLRMEYLPLYTPEQIRRHTVKPGITGWAQVNGRNAITWEEKFALDVWYVDNQSFFLLDVKILWLTFLKVIRSEDINQNGHATMPFFKGVEKQ